jgi:thiol-disulfide isomerase/thioredoxin
MVTMNRLPWMRTMLATSILCLALTSASAEEAADGVLVGPITREQVEASHPDWVQAEVAASPDAEAAHGLAGVPPGAEVTVFLGTWCGDSAREVPRLWRSLDEAGASVPFQLHYVGVDREKKQPAAPIANFEIEFVPTFIVSREGREVGRIVEHAPHGVERDLLALLTGQAHGVLSASQAGEAGASSR